MPANYDMIISQSPPVFSHSPPTGFLSEYTASFRRPYEPPQGMSRSQMSYNHGPRSFLQHQMKAINIFGGTKKLTKMPRSCLAKSCQRAPTEDATTAVVDECEDDDGVRITSADEIDGTALRWKPKKSVIFADDKGLELTQVKIMSEPSNVPPYWSLQFLAEVTHGLISPVSTAEEWVVNFKQPACDYLQFRQKLEEQNVSLENVIVKETESIVVGTIKVKNLGYNKEVIVRVTYDQWKSQEDIYCTYNNAAGMYGSYALYDTFSFKLTLPPSSRRQVEFCVCFRCNDTEYWDNNKGNNYTLSKRMNTAAAVERDGILASPFGRPCGGVGPNKLSEVTTIIQDLKDSWNMASTNDGSRPYW